MSINIADIKNQIDKHNIISFDIFDTLLKRNVLYPYDVFTLVELAYSRRYAHPVCSFREKRIQAESARRRKSNQEEVTLDEIYEELPYDVQTIQALKDIELEIESAVLTVNSEVKEIYDYAILQHKSVVIISDIYLPYQFIKERLEEHGYIHYDELLISSELKKTKNKGSIFRFLLKKLEVNPKDILHIGDNWKTDFFRPLQYKIHSLHIPNRFNKCLYQRVPQSHNITQNILYSFINNNAGTEHFMQIGYETLGPVLLAFCHWLKKYKEALKLEKLVFLSRDGQIIHQAYMSLFPEDNVDYIYVSRRSLTVPLIWKQKNLEDILKIIPVYQYYNEIRILIDRLGLEYESCKQIIEDLGFKGSDTLHRNEIIKSNKFRILFDRLKEQIYSNSKKEYVELVNYINSLHLNNNIGIVDIGWAGTMQRMLHKIFCEMNKNVHINGFYVGLTKKGNDACGFLFNPDDKNFIDTLFALKAFISLFELFFSANHGSVKKYNKCFPIFYEFEFLYNEKSKTDYQILCQIQNGALKFINDFNKTALGQFMDWTPETAFLGMKNLGINPHHTDLKILGSMYFFDNKIDYLAYPMLKNIAGFRDFKKKLFSTGWKIGYLKRLLYLPLPYFRLYKIIRKKY